MKGRLFAMDLRLRLLGVGVLAVAGLCPVAMASGPESGQMPPGISQRLSELADEPATHTGLTFDRSMMQMAQSVLEAGGMDADLNAFASWTLPTLPEHLTMITSISAALDDDHVDVEEDSLSRLPITMA